jgi:hypothetical protein
MLSPNKAHKSLLERIVDEEGRTPTLSTVFAFGLPRVCLTGACRARREVGAAIAWWNASLRDLDTFMLWPTSSLVSPMYEVPDICMPQLIVLLRLKLKAMAMGIVLQHAVLSCRVRR